jgi:hypothetical protein
MNKPPESVPLSAILALIQQLRRNFPAAKVRDRITDDYWAGQCSGANKVLDAFATLCPPAPTETDRP